jgi:hypothetical protein
MLALCDPLWTVNLLLAFFLLIPVCLPHYWYMTLLRPLCILILCNALLVGFVGKCLELMILVKGCSGFACWLGLTIFDLISGDV